MKDHLSLNDLSSLAADLLVQVARDTFPEGGDLKCYHCGHVAHFTTDQAADYLAHGWPKHCGDTMRPALETE